MKKRLGDMLLETGLINNEQLHTALSVQKKEGGKLGHNLVKLGFVTEEQITNLLEQQFGVPACDLSKMEVDEKVVKLIPAQVAQKFQIMPVNREGKTLILAMANPADVFTVEDIKFATGFDVQPVVCAESLIEKAIEKYYGVSGSLADVVKEIEKTEDLEVLEVKKEEEMDVSQLALDSDAAPVVKLVNSIIIEGVRRHASDIHIEPYKRVLRIRYRIDGALTEVMSPSYRMGPAIASRIKLMASLDISERRIPQDGHISLKVGDKSIDLRVSTLPTAHGEKIVMRIAEQSGLSYDMAKLGLEKKSLDEFLKSISRPTGIILVTGPTGSGKTVTLYSALTRLNTLDKNITTAEEPIEYDFPGINQVSVNEDIGYTFAKALRAFLRQDPNIIMVGEIRDGETADIAIKAALTGHLVLSTLHTNDASSTITRIIDMGIEPYLLAPTLALVEAQRLVRRICPKCKEPVSLTPEMIGKLGMDSKEFEGVTLYEGKGCLECNNTGYKGRVGIFEVLPVTSEIRELILKRASNDEIKQKAVELGMTTLRSDGVAKIKQGMTTIEEIIRETV